MKANTIRLEKEILSEIEKIIEPDQSLASFVRAVLLKEIKRHKMKEGADRYVELLAKSDEVREEEAEWSAADLTSEKSESSGRKKK